ncbi:MAG: RNA methyltransferase [Deltaproteobacteria bacterium]|jgi:tRNA G18 (ribose-2'-O)-methylase SpoU|nr:RNA methyltransferase [Deltaproteobacteria bacterium]MBW2541276.1 RNA methyltransferase [Deltaproteobacteria bacterium]
MRLELIEQLDDPRISIYRNVKDSALRDARGLFVVESRLCVQRLISASEYPVCSVLVTETALGALRDVFQQLGETTPIYVASSALLEKLVGYNLHRGCIALARRGAERSLEEILESQPRLLVGLEQVANPENVGNVFRNAMGFGADAVLLSRGCADPLYRKAVRVSMGGTLLTPFARLNGWPAAIDRLRAAGFATAALSTGAGAIDLAAFGGQAAVERRIALVLGAESEGLDEATLAAVDWRLKIPMAHGVDSLNVATAAGIALHHCFRLLQSAGDRLVERLAPATEVFERN